MKAVVLGVGKMGMAIAYDLCHSPGVHQVTIVDADERRVNAAAIPLPKEKIKKVTCDLRDQAQVTALLRGNDVAVSATDYSLHEVATRAAIEAGCHLCDLGGNIHVVARQRALSAEAEKAGVCIIPDCGLAPGMAGLLGVYGLEKLDRADSIKLRVGGLPRHPKPPLNYKLVFSVRGLINEYLELSEILLNGQITRVPSLIGLESLEFGAPLGTLEAFNTSGGASTLPETLQGRIKNLDYKTLRYPGHAQLIKAFFDLGFFSEQEKVINGVRINPRQFSEALLEEACTNDDTDVVAVWVEVVGEKDGKPARWTARIYDEADPSTGHSAMMRTTSYPTSIIAQLLGAGEVKARGVIPAELCVPLGRFVAELAPRKIIVEESLRF
jgi:lysine 6-dehydrogenase